MATQPLDVELHPPTHHHAMDEVVLHEGDFAEEEEAPPRRRAILGGDMGKRILGIVAFCVVALVLYWAYERYRDRANDSGEIRGDVVNASSGDTTDKTPVVSQPQPQPKAVVTQPEPQQQAVQTVAAVPANDTIAPNPPNGMAFTGNGKYQVYRQGNLTWRVDTGTGHACILFATMEEWQKRIVYSHGCGNR